MEIGFGNLDEDLSKAIIRGHFSQRLIVHLLEVLVAKGILDERERVAIVKAAGDDLDRELGGDGFPML
jgi:hypothetical protein